MVAQINDSKPIAGLVSIIMPFFNTRKEFFLEAIEAVQRQTFGHWELMLVDDGSKPPLSNVARRVAAQHADRIKYLEHDGHQNHGISTSRNLGISVARGEYIAFLDADDVWDERQLEEQVEILGQHPSAAMLYGNTTYWHSWKEDTHQSESDIHYELGVRTDQIIQPPRLLRLILQRRALPPCMTCIIVRRCVFDHGELFEDEFRAHFEDQVFFAKVAANYPVYVSSRVWGRYRQNAESVTADDNDPDIARAWRHRYLLWLTDYLKANGLEDSVLSFIPKLEIWMFRNRFRKQVMFFLRPWLGRLRRLFVVFRRE
jgi:glycosyltransferase involved in cell wall biosynthesis